MLDRLTARFARLRTQTVATVLMIGAALQQAGVLTLTPETIRNAAVGLGGLGLYFLRAAIKPKYEPPEIKSRRPAGAATLVGLCAVLLLTTGCGSVGVLDSLARITTTVGDVVEDIRATAITDPSAIGEAELDGAILLVRHGGIDVPLVCLGKMAARCRGWQQGQPLHIERALVRKGAIDLDGKTHDTYWEADKCRAALGDS